MINLNDKSQVFPSVQPEVGMKGSNNNGGPAFPMCMPTAAGTGVVYGMTLRDYFAVKAMQAFLTRDVTANAADKVVAAWSYETADAMLLAREGPECQPRTAGVGGEACRIQGQEVLP